MRFIAFFPLLFMVVSTILTVLLILAGYKASFMENYPLITFNTSLLGEGIVEDVAGSVLGGSGLSSLEGSLATRTTPELPTLVERLTIPSSIQSAIAGSNASAILNEIAQVLNIHDFYNVHLLDFCEGYYEPDPVITSSNPSPSMNVTYCSPAQAFSFFNATEVLQDELADGITLNDIQFPSQIQDAINAVAIAQKVMFGLYLVGAIFGGIAVISAIIAFFGNGRVGACCNVLVDLLTFLLVGAASGIATAFTTIIVNAANHYGAQVNLQAYQGTNFLILTWIATALPLVASILWCLDCCIGPGRRNRNKEVY